MSRTFARRLATAVLTISAITALSPSAHAENDPDRPRASDLTAAYDVAPCDPDGTTSRDAALAEELNDTLTADMEGYMSAYRVSCARRVVEAVRDRGMVSRAAVIAITTVIVETHLQNISEEVDHDSLGLFQQRASWGSATNRLNPIWATNAFLDKMVREYPNNSWRTAPIGEVCQAVQVSAFPDRYQHQAGDAQKIVNALWEPAPTFSDGGDFNADDVGDIAAVHETTGVLYNWNGSGNNGFSAAIELGPGWAPYSRPVAGDFNNDDRSDLAAIHETTGVLTLWNGTGNNSFSAAVPLGSGWAPYASTLTALGDVNNDDRSDLAAINRTTGTLYLWNSTGTNSFGPAIERGPGWNTYSRPAAGDFNNDGRSDLAAINQTTGKLTLWNSTGNNAFGAAVPLGPGWTPYADTLMTLGDVNEDGRSDLGAVNQTTGTLYLWNGTGTNAFGPAIPRGTGWNAYF